MQNHTTPPARGQWASTAYQVMTLRPGVGVQMQTVDPAARLRPVPPALVGTKRGKVVGFTRESAARLRELLFRLDYPEGLCFGLALTSAPWVTRTPSDAFAALTRDAPRCPGLRCAVWRKEVTRRGLEHYHLVVWVKAPEDLAPVRVWLVSRWVRHLLAVRLCPARCGLSGNRRLVAVLDALDPVGLRLVEAAQSSLLLVNLSPRNYVALDRVSGVQYLCDHTSKHKAYQAATTGRAWGVWCRGALPRLELPGVSLEDCPRRLLADLRHALAKMSRYWWPDASAPFGYRWSRPRRFSAGTKVLFRPAAPDTLRRLVDAWNASHGARRLCSDADAQLGCTPRRTEPPAALAKQDKGQAGAGE